MTPRSGLFGIKRDVWLLGVLGVVALLVVGFLVIDRAGNSSETSSAADASAEELEPSIGPVGDMSRRKDGDPLARGPVDAPVVLVVYSDYRCPFCAKFSRDTERQLVEKYVDAGVLRIEWRDLPLFGEQSMAAARAGRAAAAQGKFWEFNSALYASAPDRGHPDLSAAALRGFAERAGVPDLDRFAGDAADSALDEDIAADVLEANVIGVSSTPSFVIDGYPILGAQPLSVFEQVIAKAGGTQP
ncbi:disulfide bond formation protein [Prescottella agglutinans]|uniref:Disulfide bond formation protein n=1 Tax=Prescottella agglutinans TaxID=1644129 RepID=A0A438B9G6_9NOCA|nr:thioredoxin domain-containing protein [Prescottella agglutinans]RVW07614.1 disulfide bond formation protein [Prescottella agglutinans]